jgi:hypothetical protein
MRRLPPFAGLRHSYRCDPKGGASEMTATCQNPPVLGGIDLVALSRAGAAELSADARSPYTADYTQPRYVRGFSGYETPANSMEFPTPHARAWRRQARPDRCSISN